MHKRPERKEKPQTKRIPLAKSLGKQNIMYSKKNDKNQSCKKGELKDKKIEENPVSK